MSFLIVNNSRLSLFCLSLLQNRHLPHHQQRVFEAQQRQLDLLQPVLDPRGTRIHLAWSLQGAESLQLEQMRKDGATVLIAKWDTQPFPREYAVTVEADTTYRLTACAEDMPASARRLTITIDAAPTTAP